MRAMVLKRLKTPLEWTELEDRRPGPNEIRIQVKACGVCRTDLHVLDGELPGPVLPITPGHEIVGRVDAIGTAVKGLELGERVGIPWLGHTDGVCPYCLMDRENLCDRALFTGFTRDGDGKKLGLFGFGAAGHILAQVAKWQRRSVYAFTKPGDTHTQAFALSLGAIWAGGSDERVPEPLDAAIIFAPVGALVPVALRAVRKGGRVVCAGIHMSDIPSFPYSFLWEERELVSVANLTRKDGIDFLHLARQIGIVVKTTRYPLQKANQALADLRAGRFEGAAVLTP
jgi:propanol-preferring alcohol dehydrogenase